MTAIIIPSVVLKMNVNKVIYPRELSTYRSPASSSRGRFASAESKKLSRSQLFQLILAQQLQASSYAHRKRKKKEREKKYGNGGKSSQL